MLYLVRHGETEWNAQGRYQGASDSPLTPRGRDQAQAVGALLAREIGGPIRAYVSPLGRTRQTAALIGAHVALEIVPEPRIAEVSMGSWDGLTRPQIEQRHPGALGASHDWYFRSLDGETLAAALARIGGWLQAAERPAVVVSHGLARRLIRGLYLGLSEPDMLALPVPQDGFFVLTDGRVEFRGA